MSGYGQQFCPIAQALEVIGERWTLLLVRELLCGSSRFSDLRRGLPLISRSVLAQRLKLLTEAGVVERRGGGYFLTEAGQELREIVIACGVWGKRWVRHKLRSSDVDVGLLMWDIQRRIDVSALPDERIVVELELRGAPRGKGRFWLKLSRGEVELCLTPPHEPATLHVYTTPKALAQIWLGELSFHDAERASAIDVVGPRALARAFPSWLQLSVFAATERHAA
jgi:DNA-binding HxlR family transcriptional regulator